MTADRVRPAPRAVRRRRLRLRRAADRSRRARLRRACRRGSAPAAVPDQRRRRHASWRSGPTTRSRSACTTSPPARPSARAGYAYLGPVFRQRPGESGEFLQAGVESLGRSDRVAADADMLDARLRGGGAARRRASRRSRIGDSALFAALLDALDLARAVAAAAGARLRRHAAAEGADRQLPAATARRRTTASSPRSTAPITRRAPRGRGPARRDRPRRGRRPHAPTRSPSASLEKAALAAGVGAGAPRAGARPRSSPSPARRPRRSAALRALARARSSTIGKALDRFEQRTEAFADHGIDVDRLDLRRRFRPAPRLLHRLRLRVSRRAERRRDRSSAAAATTG